MSRVDVDIPLHWTILRLLTRKQIKRAKEVAWSHMKHGRSPEFRASWSGFYFALCEHEDDTSPNEFTEIEKLA